ncbi:hypothetical protein D3C78_1259030 [compost metagenome]
MGEVDFETQLEAVVGVEARPLEVLAFAFTHFHGPFDADEALGRILQLHARALQQEHEGRRGAVENGHFLGRDVDVQIVQPQAGDGRHQVLDRVHLGPALANRRGHARVRHRMRGDRDIDRLGQIDAPKHNARVGGSGAQGQLHALAAVQAHAHSTGNGLEGALLQHMRILSSPAMSRPPPGHRHGYHRDGFRDV